MTDQQYCHSYHVTKTDLLKFSFEKCIITRSTEEGGLKVTLSTTQTFIYMLHAISCPAHHWLTSGYLQSCYTHPIRQAGGICLWQTVNTAVQHWLHTCRSGRGAFAPFNTAEVHISGFDCCLDNCTVFYAVTTNQSILGVTEDSHLKTWKHQWQQGTFALMRHFTLQLTMQWPWLDNFTVTSSYH